MRIIFTIVVPPKVVHEELVEMGITLSQLKSKLIEDFEIPEEVSSRGVKAAFVIEDGEPWKD